MYGLMKLRRSALRRSETPVDDAIGQYLRLPPRASVWFCPAALAFRPAGAYIGAAYFFTSSASFANPAITIGRMFSDTFAGIAPASAPAFIAAQILGGLVAIAVIKLLYPGLSAAAAARLTVPHDLGYNRAPGMSYAARPAKQETLP